MAESCLSGDHDFIPLILVNISCCYGYRQFLLSWLQIILVVMVAGDSDPMVAFQYGRSTADFMQTFNKSNFTFKSYAGLGHSSSPEVS